MKANPILVPYKPEHLYMVEERDSALQLSIQQAMEKMNGMAFTAMVDKRPIGSAGVVISWPGFGTAWAIFGADIANYPVWTTRTVRNMFRDIIRIKKLYRVELTALKDSDRNKRWAELLGFSRENGCARMYTMDRRDVVRYEWIYDI